MMSTDLNEQSIPTPPPPVETVTYAGFWIRFVAFLIDGLILCIPTLVLNHMVPFVGSFILSLLYKPFFECSRLQATPGKALMGLRVTTTDGSRLTLKNSFIRYAGTILSSLTMTIGYIMAGFTEKKQALHDIVANTVVIFKAPPQGMNYLDAWIHEIQAAFGFANETQKSTNIPQKLEELHGLFSKGLITEAEYNQKKEELLKRI